MDDILSGLGASVGISAESGDTAQPESAAAAPNPFEGSETPVATPETGIPTPEPEPSSLNARPDQAETEKPENAEMTEEEVREMIANPMTPRQLREKLEKGLQYAEKFKQERNTFEEKYNEISSKISAYEGKEALPTTEVERLRAAEQAIYDLQSFTATPETIEKRLRELNPSVYRDYQNHTVMNALFTPEGTPDLENLQFVIDRAIGQGPNGERVYAKDLLLAAEALKNGKLTQADLHDFDSIEAYESFQRSSAKEQEVRRLQEQAAEAVKFQESQVRAAEIEHVRHNIRSEIKPQIESSMAKFKLAPVENEPKIAQEFKAELRGKIDRLFAQATSEIRSLSEIQKAVEIVGSARGVSPQQAAEEVRSLVNNPVYRQHLAAGTQALMDRVDKLLAREAHMYKLLMLGYEAENGKGQKAREVIGKPNQQNGNLPNYTEEQLKSMTADERNHYNKVQFSQQLRAMQPGQAADRLGG